jgi:hypothetical protein
MRSKSKIAVRTASCECDASCSGEYYYRDQQQVLVDINQAGNPLYPYRAWIAARLGVLDPRREIRIDCNGFNPPLVEQAPSGALFVLICGLVVAGAALLVS